MSVKLSELKLPDLHGPAVQISNDLNEGDQYDRFLLEHFECEHTRKFIKSNYLQADIEKYLQNWTLKIDNLTLSQSKIKGFWSVVNGEACPKAYKESLYRKDISIYKESESMIKGQVFEYLATGQKNYNGNIPDLSVLETKTGKETAFSIQVNSQVETWKNFARSNGLKRIKTGHVEKFSNEKFSIACTTDLVCQMNGKDVVFDLKLSDPSGKFGLAKWADNELTKAEILLIQAKVTKYIFFKNYLKDVPFIFYIASPSNDESKARQIDFKDFESMIDETEKLIESTFKGMKFLIDFDLLKPQPDVKFCEFCRVDCDLKTKIPIIKSLEI